MHSPAQQRLAAADARRGAAARAARAAAASRREAAAARRLVLTLALLAVTAATWTLVGLASAPMVLAIVPTALFFGVLVLSRRAAKQAKAADARLAQEVQRARRADQARAARIAASTHARENEAPEGQSSLRVDVDPARLIVGEELESETVTQSDQPWTPVPVPAPVYTMKPAAPRRDVEPVGAVEAGMEQTPATSVASPAAPAASAGPEQNGEQTTAQTDPASRPASREHARERTDGSDGGAGDIQVPRAEPNRPSAAAPSVDLQEVLERRRAVGQ